MTDEHKNINKGPSGLQQCAILIYDPTHSFRLSIYKYGEGALSKDLDPTSRTVRGQCVHCCSLAPTPDCTAYNNKTDSITSFTASSWTTSYFFGFLKHINCTCVE